LSAQSLISNKSTREKKFRDPLILLAVCLSLYFFRLGNFGILEGGESYYPAAAREMVQAHEWLIPQLNYQIYFSKPILTFWLIESAYVLLGVTELAGRLWSSILCTLLVYVCYFTTRALAGKRAGLLAGLMLASSPLLVATCRRSSIDAFFSCFLGMALCAMIMVLFAGNRRWWPIIYAGLALSVLTKGPASLVLFVGGLVVYLGLQKSSIKQIIDCLNRLRIFPGMLLFLAMVLPWYLAVGQATNGLFLKVFFLYENLSRFAGNTNSGKHPHWWAYLPALLYGAFPWSLFLPAAVVDACAAVKSNFVRTAKVGESGSPAEEIVPKESAQNDPHLGVLVFSLAYILFTVVFFSVSRTQFDRYILPIWCPIVIMISLSIDKWIFDRDQKWIFDRAKSATAISAKLVSPLLAFLGCASFIASIVAAFIIKDVDPWMRIAAPLATLVLAVGWIWQFASYRKSDYNKSVFVLAMSTCLGYAIATPILFEYWYEKSYAGVHQLVMSVADSDADVGQYKEFMPSLLYYRKGPVNFFYHLSQLLPRKTDSNDKRTFILVKKDFEPELLAQPQLNLKLHSRSGEWSMYETGDFVMDKPPTLEESFNRLNWKDSTTDRFGFGPLTVPYSGGHKPWIR
jgi:4-amino-4-deoxy-L-arabinose transferase-like glycosyltransferase